MIIINMEKAIKNLIMVLSIKVLILKVNLRDMEDTLGIMDNLIKANGLMEWKMVLVYGEDLKEILILGNGKMEKQMDMEYILGLMEIDIKDNFLIV